MGLTKKLDKLNDVVTGVLITTIASRVLSLLNQKHKKDKKHAKHHHQNHKCECKKHKCECSSKKTTCKDVLPLVVGTTAVVRGIKKGNKYNVFSSALFTVIAFKLFVFKRKH